MMHAGKAACIIRGIHHPPSTIHRIFILALFSRSCIIRHESRIIKNYQMLTGGRKTDIA
jgi:hypothetical protein